jgi:hypothetical protein
VKAILTNHSIERCEERLGLKVESLQRLADCALENGINHADTSGKLRRYMDRIFLTAHSGNNNRIYGEHIFVFAGRTLVTVLLLPNEFRRAVAKLRSRKEPG